MIRTDRPSSAFGVWLLLQGVLSLGIAGGIGLLGYALVPLRVEKMEVVYRTEGVQFAAGPEGVPPDKWQRMSATQQGIVEPMANWLVAAGATSAVLMATVQCLLWRLRPAVLRPMTTDTTTENRT